MLSSKSAAEMAAALPDVSMKDHFGGDAFYANKRIFATVWHDNNEVNVRLKPTQHHYSQEKGGEAFRVIPNSWGQQGWIAICLEFIEKELFEEALKAAWETSVVKFSVVVGNKT